MVYDLISNTSVTLCGYLAPLLADKLSRVHNLSACFLQYQIIQGKIGDFLLVAYSDTVAHAQCLGAVACHLYSIQ